MICPRHAHVPRAVVAHISPHFAHDHWSTQWIIYPRYQEFESERLLDRQTRFQKRGTKLIQHHSNILIALPPPQKKKNQTRSFYLLPRSKKTSQEPRPHRENRFGFCCRERNENKEKKNLSFSQRGRLRRKKRGGMVSRISVSGKAIKPGIWMD